MNKVTTLPPLPEKLDAECTKSLCMAMLHLTIKDASKKEYKDEALWFAKSDLCRNICEFYDIDYTSFLDKVESNYKGRKRGKQNKVHSK